MYNDGENLYHLLTGNLKKVVTLVKADCQSFEFYRLDGKYFVDVRKYRFEF